MAKDEISLTIAQFIQEAIHMKLVESIDEIYLRNRLLSYLELNEFIKPKQLKKTHLLDSLEEMLKYAIKNDIIEDYNYTKDIFEAKIMNLVTPVPSQVNKEFWNKYNNDKQSATDYFYDLSKKNNYIKTRRIAKNIFFETKSPYGNLEITINLSKPEKDPKEIAALTQTDSIDYPKCALCMENEGYQGHANHAARENHRIVRMQLDDEIYGMQYSPYVYYNEHSIFLNEEHKPMLINQKSIENLINIIEKFPHYFVGSNADLPIVGGSILTHDHYQGGHYNFPIEEAKSVQSVELTNFTDVSVSIVQWPLSVLRLKTDNKQKIIDVACHIMDTWEYYTDEEYNIISHTEKTRHNTITPIARYKNGIYEMDVVLRNNRTTTEYPDGIFHPHPNVHHIKKENIGLVEVMGLAILPPRLVEELDEIEQFLLGKSSIDKVKDLHKNWAMELKDKKNDFTEENLPNFLQQEVGNKFSQVLEHAGVYKQSDKGIRGFNKFLNALNNQETMEERI